MVVFRRKYVKPESVATAKHKWHKINFDPIRQSLPDFLEELHQGAEKAFGENANQMTNSLLYAKLPPHLTRSVNIAYLENGSYEEIVQHLERELELNGLEGDNVQSITISTTQKSDSRPQNVPRDASNVDCYYCKEKEHFANDCKKLERKREREQREEVQDTGRRTFPPCDHCGLTNHSTERCWRNPNNKNPNTSKKNDQPSTSSGTPQNPSFDENILNNRLHLNKTSHDSVLQRRTKE